MDALVYHYRPRRRETNGRRFPGEREVLTDVGSAGLRVGDVGSPALPVARALVEFRERLGDRPHSKFPALTESEFAEGLARLDADARGRRGGSAVEERYDLVVLERPALE